MAAAVSNTVLKGYLVDIENRERLEFQYNPSEIGDNKTADYADIKIPGISHPKHQFIAGGTRRIAFKLFLFKDNVKQQVAWLQSLLYPEHSGSMLKSPPHRVIFIFGELYPGIVCIVRQVKARYFNLFDQNSLAPQQAEVDVVLDEWVEESINLQKRDVSELVHSPYIFNGERDPRYLKPWQVKQVLAAAQGDSTIIGKRNYAILVLLAIYGMRGKEVASLRLDDLCWKTRKLTLRRRKCGDTLVLPLLAEAGRVLVAYLSVRPASPFREIFLSVLKPFHPLKRDTLGDVAARAIARCGINVVHPGTHTFRFSNAQSLFQTQSPLSEIAGILGHSNLTTTLGYLSFVVEPLREVAINDGEVMA